MGLIVLLILAVLLALLAVQLIKLIGTVICEVLTMIGVIIGGFIMIGKWIYGKVTK